MEKNHVAPKRRLHEFWNEQRWRRDVKGVWITAFVFNNWNVEMPKRIDWKLIIAYEIYELYTVFTVKWTNCFKYLTNAIFLVYKLCRFQSHSIHSLSPRMFSVWPAQLFFCGGLKFNPMWSFGPDKKHKNWLIAVPCQSNAVYVGTA